MKRSSILAAALMAMASSAFAGVEVPKAPPPTVTADAKKRKRMLLGHATGITTARRRGPGWTHAHVQRMANKARNRRRNKLAHRGRR